LSPQSDLVVFYFFNPSDWNEISSTRHNDLLILHIDRNTVTVLFGCSTGGIVSDLSPAYEDQISQLTFQQFILKKRNRMSGKKWKETEIYPVNLFILNMW
jgi:hypothetical protein